MKVLKISIHFIFILSLFSCSRQFKVAKVMPGLTHVDDALRILDEPLYAEQSSLDRSSKIYIWDDVSIQVQNSFVTAVHRQPASHEKTLQFWHQYYKDAEKSFTKIQNLDDTAEELWQLDLPEHGLNVIYDERNDQVMKVVKYEIK